MRIMWGIAALAIALTAGCAAAEESDPTTAKATAATRAITPAPVAVPKYELEERDKGFRALVRTDDTDELQALFRELSGRVLAGYPAGGYFVWIDCAIGDQPGKAANRLAVGRIAVGPLGAAQTGLAAGKTDIEYQPGRTCHDGAVTKTFDPSRQLDKDYALELCQGRLEKKYLAGQLPLTLSNVNVIESNGKWVTTGVSRGSSKPGAPAVAAVSFTCVSEPNPLRTEVTRFEY